jgi:hypothetical protein
VAVAVPGASLDALIGCRSYVLGHLGLKDLLHHSLADLTQKTRIVQQNILYQFSIHPYDDQWSSSLLFDWLTLGTNHLGGPWPFFLAGHHITEDYGHNLLECVVFTAGYKQKRHPKTGQEAKC